MKTKATLVLLRHGESLWNKKSLFTGWTDVGLSERGIKEAKQAGRSLKAAGFNFDLAYTSVLSRAIHTLWLALDQMQKVYTPIINAWQLNERHYGALQGLNKKQMARKVGAEQVQIWRRSYDIRPPKINRSLYTKQSKDPRYKTLTKTEIPWCESLEDTCHRVWPYYQAEIAPKLKQGKSILISAHGNSLRGLIKHLDNISDQDIPNLEIPYASPLVYEFGLVKNRLVVIKKYYLQTKTNPLKNIFS